MKKVFRSPIFSAALLLLAVFLLAFGSVGGTRAALNIESDIYDSQIRLGNISVALLSVRSVTRMFLVSWHSVVSNPGSMIGKINGE